MKRLSHPHQDNIVDSEVLAYSTNLVDNFAGAQVSLQTKSPGEAKRALHGTANLGGDTQGVAATFHRDQDGFHALAII